MSRFNPHSPNTTSTPWQDFWPGNSDLKCDEERPEIFRVIGVYYLGRYQVYKSIKERTGLTTEYPLDGVKRPVSWVKLLNCTWWGPQG